MMSSGFWKKQLYVLRLAFSAGLGGFIYGYCVGVMNNFLPSYSTTRTEFDINSLARQRLIFESTAWPWWFFHGYGSCYVFLSGGLLTERRHGLQTRDLATWACPFFIVGAFLIVTFPDNLGRVPGTLLIGFATGYIFVGSTIYLAEISPTRIRGAIVCTFFLQIAAGQIAYYLLALLLFDSSIDHDNDKKYLEKWHWMLGIIPVLFKSLLRIIWLPESPNWLYALGKKEEAIEILRKTRPCVDDVAREVEALKLSVKEIERVEEKELQWSEKMIAGIACLVAEHLVGMNMVMYYTPRIVVHHFQKPLQYSSSNYFILATLLIRSVLSAIGALLCIAFVDRYGRRRLLLLSTFGIITCLGFLSFVIYGLSSTSTATVDVTAIASCTINGNGGTGMGNLGLLALGALGLYFIFHSMGIGTIPWIINSEIYPLGGRICYGIKTSVTYWFIKVWMSFFYGYLDDVIGQYNIGNVFAILCLSSCVACCIVYVYALETKGYPIEEVEKLLLLEKKLSHDLKLRQVILTSREEIPYMFSSSSSDDE